MRLLQNSILLAFVFCSWSAVPLERLVFPASRFAEHMAAGIYCWLACYLQTAIIFIGLSRRCCDHGDDVCTTSAPVLA